MSLNFKYNPEKLRIESNDPEIFVEKFGLRREGPYEMALNYKTRKIGIHLSSKRSMDEDGKEHLCEWILENVYNEVWRHNKEGKMARYCFGGKFEDKLDQDNIIKIIKNALFIFDATREPPKTDLLISISPALQRRLDKGDLIK